MRYLVADTKPPSDKKEGDKNNDKSTANGSDKGNGEKKDGEGKKDDKPESALEIAIREAKVKYFKSQLGTPEATTVFETLYPTAVKEHPTDLSLVQVGLSHRVKCKTQALAKIPKTKVTRATATEGSTLPPPPPALPPVVIDDGILVDVLIACDLVVAAATAVTALIDVDAVARNLGDATLPHTL